jgi:hypothetical protein
MMRSLLLFGKSMLLVLSLVCFGSGQLVAQPPNIEDEQQVDFKQVKPFIQFLGFVNNCDGINFQLIVGGISQFYNEVDWITDNQQTVTLPPNGVFTLTDPSSSVRAQRFSSSVFGRFPVGSQVVINTPSLPPFTVEADPETVNMCPFVLGETSVISNRCVGTTSWSSTVFPFFGAAPGGIGVQFQNESAGFGFDPTSSIDLAIVPNTPLLLGAFNIYLIELVGTETLSGAQKLENILVISFDDCSDIPPGFQVSDELLADFVSAANRVRGPVSADDLASRGLLNRLNDELRSGGDQASSLSSARDMITVNNVANDDIAVFPNPASDLITVSYRSTPAQLRLLDVTGRTVRELQSTGVGIDQTNIQVSALQPGIYLLEAITTAGDREVRKVQISR